MKVSSTNNYPKRVPHNFTILIVLKATALTRKRKSSIPNLRIAKTVIEAIATHSISYGA